MNNLGANHQMGDKEVLADSLASQKMITGTYNTFANECANVKLRDDFLSILNEEHQIQTDIFSEMQRHGWYQVQPADQQQITQVRQKLQNG